MALSNMFREPQREITETAIGAVPFIAFGVADYWFATWASVTWFEGTPGDFWGCLLMIGPFLALVLLALAFVLPIFVHFIGEAICDALPIDPRPRNRK